MKYSSERPFAPAAVALSAALFALLLSVFLFAGRAQAIGGDSSDEATPFYAIWNDDTKVISFSATQPGEGVTCEEVREVRSFIRSHNAEVKTIDFAFVNAEGVSEKIKLAADEGAELFNECVVLEEIKNLPNLDTSQVTDMQRMFRKCYQLKTLDLSGFDTSKATSMRNMFRECYELTAADTSGFDTGNVTDMGLMFYMCHKIREINVSSFNTAKVRSMYFMFGYCKELRSLDCSSFKTPSLVTDSSGYPCLTAFCYGCPKLESIDIRNFANNAGSTCFQNGFSGCGNIERLVLGPETTLKNSSSFAPAGLSGNWIKEGGDGTVLSTANLYDLFSSSGTRPAGTYVRSHPEGHYYRSDGSLDKDNVWEVHAPSDRFKAYCLNKGKKGVGQYLDRVEVTSDEQLISLLDEENEEYTHGYEPLGSNMKEALITLIYYGYPNDAAGIQEEFGLTDDEFMEITQIAIWDFVSWYHDKSGHSHDSEKMRNAYQRLLEQRFANIPGTYRLYLYIPWDNVYQNMLSIQGLSDGAYGGVEIMKQDSSGTPLQGAEFTIYKPDGTVVDTMVSRADGIASICDLSYRTGLALGDYMVKETKPPHGYVKDSTTYYFSVTEAGQIVTLGQKRDESGQLGEPEQMTIINTPEAEYQGGGISVKKVSDSGKPLIEAEFTIYKNGEEYTKIITDDDGIAATAPRELELGSYTIKETRAPAGYVLSDREESFTISADNEFRELAFTFENKSKSGEATLEAMKVLTNGELKGGDFTFKLTSEDGQILQEKTNDKDGIVIFDPITFTADDLGFVNYHIVEENTNKKSITYDSHTEHVTVMIIDSGGESLECYVVYDEDGPVFTNKQNDVEDTYEKPKKKKKTTSKKRSSSAATRTKGVDTGDDPAVTNCALLGLFAALIAVIIRLRRFFTS